MLVIPAQDSKTRRPEEWEIPTSLLPYLEHYLASIRPFFRGSDQHDWLWASDKGGGLKGDWIYRTVSRATGAAFGVAVNLHLFRDCVATTIARAAPERIAIATALLNHADPATTETHYNQAQSLNACRRNAAHPQLRPLGPGRGLGPGPRDPRARNALRRDARGA